VLHRRIETTPLLKMRARNLCLTDGSEKLPFRLSMERNNCMTKPKFSRMDNSGDGRLCVRPPSHPASPIGSSLVTQLNPLLIDLLNQPVGHLWDHDWPVLHRAMLAAAEQPQVALLRRLVGRHQVWDGVAGIARAIDHE